MALAVCAQDVNHALISFVVYFSCPGTVLREKELESALLIAFAVTEAEWRHFPFIVTVAAVSCLTDVLYLHVALRISICRNLFYGKALAQVLAAIQIFQSQNLLSCAALLVHLPPEVESPLLLVYSFSTHIAQQMELGLYLSS